MRVDALKPEHLESNVFQPDSYSKRPLLSGICFLTFLVFTSTTWGTEYLQSQNTAPTSVRELDSPLDAALKKEEKKVHRIQLEEIKHRLKNYPRWIRDEV